MGVSLSLSQHEPVFVHWMVFYTPYLCSHCEHVHAACQLHGDRDRAFRLLRRRAPEISMDTQNKPAREQGYAAWQSASFWKGVKENAGYTNACNPCSTYSAICFLHHLAILSRPRITNPIDQSQSQVHQSILLSRQGYPVLETPHLGPFSHLCLVSLFWVQISFHS